MGERFGQYEILRKIAAGGMAEVLLAKQIGIGGFERLVCLKRILPHLAEEEDFVSMFQDEARIAANLVHPNIAQIYDIGQSGDHLYIAMEYVRGEDVRHIYNQEVARGRTLPQEIAAHIAMGCAAGLDYAHRQTSIDGHPLGIVHRDISPQNILVTYDGHVKIVDFGVAKAAGKMAQTRAGVLKGKYSYMSPEQASGDPIDGRTDVFALGVTLYEVTTGTRLFKRESELETLHAVLGCQVTPPREVRRSYHPDLEQIVLKALASDADERYQSAGDMERALEHYLLCHNHAPGPSSLGTHMQELFAEKLADELLFGGQVLGDTVTPISAGQHSGDRGHATASARRTDRSDRDAVSTRPLDGNNAPAARDADDDGVTAIDVDAAPQWNDTDASAATEQVDVFAPTDEWELDSGADSATGPNVPADGAGDVTTPPPQAARAADSAAPQRHSSGPVWHGIPMSSWVPGVAVASVVLSVVLVGGSLVLCGRTDPATGSVVVELTPKPQPAPTASPSDLSRGTDAASGSNSPAPGEDTSEQPPSGQPDDTQRTGRPETAWLSVLTSPFPMTVSMKGRRVGETPVRRLALEPGVYRLRLTNKAEGVSVKRRVKLSAGRHETLHVNLGRGALVVNATPWAWVKIGKRPPRETPLRISVPEGEYSVVFECPKGRRYTKTVTVPRDAMATAVVACEED